MKKLTQSEERRKQAALTIVRTLSEETSVVAKPMSSVNVKNIPDNAEPAIRSYIRTLKNHEVYGSASMATHSIHARRPNDLDIVVTNPRKVAYDFSNIMRRKGIKTKVVGNPEWGSYVVQACQKGEWVDCCDIHPISKHGGKFDFYGSSQKPLTKNKINIQRSSDQLLRKFNAVTQIDPKTGKMGGSPHRDIKDTQDAIQIAELLLASMELKSKAQLAKAKKVKTELKVWKAHLRTLNGGKSATKTKKQKPISETRQKKFVKKAVKKPAKNVDDLIFENGKVVERKVPVSESLKTARSPYAPSPYAPSPYPTSPYPPKKRKKGSTKKRRRVRTKEEAFRNLYKGLK